MWGFPGIEKIAAAAVGIWPRAPPRAPSPRAFNTSATTGRDGGPAYKGWQERTAAAGPQAAPGVAHIRHMPEHKKHGCGVGTGRRVRLTKRKGFNSSQQTFRGYQS